MALFNMYINDLYDFTTWSALKIADDLKTHSKWQMHLNIEKYKLLQLGYNNPNQVYH